MDQNLAVRLANEGIPVAVIARVTKLPSATVRERLVEAQLSGDLLAVPCNDWISETPQPSFFDLDKRTILEQTARRVFVLQPATGQLLMLLLQHPEMRRERVRDVLKMKTDKAIYSEICRLRRKLRAVGCAIHAMYGWGYCISAAHQKIVLKLLSDKASGKA